jgi:glycosyltransferase involved in cell wall biosynthesis
MAEFRNTFLSIVIPAHNEAAGIQRSLGPIKSTVESCGMEWEIIIVDDGSSDGMFDHVAEIARKDARIKGVRFSRNFGKESALLAGLSVAQGDIVITIDADLQHPPHLIPQMIDAWKNGAKVVDAVKEKRETDRLISRVRAKMFNSALSLMGGINLYNASDYKLLDRVIVDTITEDLPERQRFYRGLSDWVGFRHARVPFDVEARIEGEGKWTFWRLVELATTAIVSFTSAPLRIVTVMGFITLIFGFVVAIEALISWVRGMAISGFATTIMTLLIIGSFIMISLGIIGEYIAKIYDEIKRRPTYIVEETVGLEDRKQLLKISVDQ